MVRGSLRRWPGGRAKSRTLGGTLRQRRCPVHVAKTGSCSTTVRRSTRHVPSLTASVADPEGGTKSPHVADARASLTPSGMGSPHLSN